MHVHVVGIGGAGMSAVARLLLDRATVSGSDSGRWPLSESLVPLGVRVYETFDRAHVAGADVVLRSSAYGEANVEVRAALDRGIPVWKRGEAWRMLAEGRRVVAVAGTHGKTTTTAMVWSALRAGGRDPSLVCGAALLEIGANAHLGRDPILVIEADEYDRAFHALAPEVAVVLNVDHDHVDVFPTAAEYAEAFRVFAAGIPRGGTLVACADDPGAAALARVARAELPGRSVVTYGRQAGADYRVGPQLRPETTPGPLSLGTPAGEQLGFRLSLRGAHNALNAAAAVAAASALGVPERAALLGLSAFAGTERRLEELGQAGGVTVVDDYAHHPAEIRASIAAMRTAGGRLVALFQPHTPSRVAAFRDAFASSLRDADVAVVAETFSSVREAPREGGARSLADAAGARYARDPEDAARVLAEIVRPGDIVLVLGAGDIRSAGLRLLERLRQEPVPGAPAGGPRP